MADESPYEDMMLSLCEAVKAGADQYKEALGRIGTGVSAANLAEYAAGVKDVALAYEAVSPKPRRRRDAPAQA
jgi:hypothetical protein